MPATTGRPTAAGRRDAVTADGATPDRRTGGTHVDRVVPVYAFTRGRTRPTGRELPIETLVTATELAVRHEHDMTVRVEWRVVMKTCRRPMSVAEIGVALGVPVGVARVLVSDLADAGYLEVHAPRRDGRDGRPGQAVLERLLDGLRAR